MATMAPSPDSYAMTTPLAPRGATIAPFYAGEIGLLAMARLRAGLPVIAMHFGQPSAGIPTRARAAAHASLDRDSSGYWLSAALKERIARHYAEVHGIDVAPERVLLTGGASAGLTAVFVALFAAGDRIGLARPGYPAYRNAL